MTKNIVPQPVRQGDVLLVPVKTIRELKAEPVVARDAGRVVLAYGEVTGHAHAILDEKVTLHRADRAHPSVREVEIDPGFDVGGILDVRGDEAVLVHEEHAPIPLPAGQYVLVRQREYEPGETPRFVAD